MCQVPQPLWSLTAQTCSPQCKPEHHSLVKKRRTSFALDSYKLTAERRALCFLGSTPGFYGCSPFPYAHLLHYSPCVIHTLFFPQMTSSLLSLSTSIPVPVLTIFFLFLFKAIYLVLWFQPILPLHISLQYISTLLFIMNNLFHFPGSRFHNPHLFFLKSQILTTCSFCPDGTYSEEAQSFE